MTKPDTQSKIRVVIIDDHPLFRDGLVTALQQEDTIDIIGQSADGSEGLDMVRQKKPDVTLLDVNLPTMNGFQVMRELKNDRTETQIVILTAYHDKEQILHAMRAGASAYCNKDIKPKDLVQTIMDVAEGKVVVNERRMTPEELDAWIQDNVQAITGPYIVDPDEHYVPLSPREMEILQLVTHGLSNQEISLQLSISQQTVKNHMTSILRKLDVKDRTQAAVTALRHGWVRLNNRDD